MVALIGVTGKNKMDTDPASRLDARLLIASPRSGSTWFVYSNIIEQDTWNYLGEFFNKDWQYWIKKINNNYCLNKLEKLKSNTLTDKINFLETERKQGREYFCKLFPSQIYNSEDHREWFYSFYKNSKIMYLQRNNKWQQFLSYLYQNKTAWKNPNPKDSKTIVPENVLCTKQDVNNWIDMNNRDLSLDMKKFKNVQCYFYEDLNLRTSTIKVSDHLNYEELIENVKDYRWMIS